MNNPKDFWAGAIYLAVGAATMVVAREYPMGTAVKMGPAYFPTLLGALLLLAGLLALIRSFRNAGQPVSAFAWKPLLLIIASIALFGGLARGMGLIPALVALVLVSAYASARFRWRSALALAAGLAIFCALLFVKGLGVPLPLWSVGLG